MSEREVRSLLLGGHRGIRRRPIGLNHLPSRLIHRQYDEGGYHQPEYPVAHYQDNSLDVKTALASVLAAFGGALAFSYLFNGNLTNLFSCLFCTTTTSTSTTSATTATTDTTASTTVSSLKSRFASNMTSHFLNAHYGKDHIVGKKF